MYQRGCGWLTNIILICFFRVTLFISFEYYYLLFVTLFRNVIIRCCRWPPGLNYSNISVCCSGAASLKTRAWIGWWRCWTRAQEKIWFRTCLSIPAKQSWMPWWWCHRSPAIGACLLRDWRLKCVNNTAIAKKQKVITVRAPPVLHRAPQCSMFQVLTILWSYCLFIWFCIIIVYSPIILRWCYNYEYQLWLNEWCVYVSLLQLRRVYFYFRKRNAVVLCFVLCCGSQCNVSLQTLAAATYASPVAR